MPLTKDQIKALLAQPQRTRGKKPKNYIDLSVRDIPTWFKVGHKMVDEETQELCKCENPDCTDTRATHMVVKINDKLMCRHCFLGGWLTDIEQSND